MAEILLGIACILFGIAMFLMWQGTEFWAGITLIFILGGIILALYGFYREHKK